jgi:Zn-dependent protease
MVSNEEPVFYRLDSRNVELREYSFGTPAWLMPVAVLLKVLRVPVSGSSDEPPVESLRPFEVTEDQLPAEARARFAPLYEELTSLGFHSPVYHFILDPLHNTEIVWATFPHVNGEALARIHYRLFNQPPNAKVHFFPQFISSFQDGTTVISSGGKQDMLTPGTVRSLHMPAATATELWTIHTQELAREKVTKSLLSAPSPEQARLLSEALHAALRDFHLKRRVFRPLTPADQANMLELARLVGTGRQSGLKYPEVHAEMQRAQNTKASLANTILLLVISLLIFLAVGRAQWSWKEGLALVGVLFFHEFGHWIAMKLFDYRNLRMFFIPFFGAAVSGSHYNVAGWKKAIVSLMGPVPGILVGSILGVLGLVYRIDWMQNASLLMLILNAFNLLPVLPLDGGWVMHTLLFSRHHLLDVTFRIFAIAGLVVLSLLLHARLLVYITIPMVLALPATYKLARIANRLRRTQLPALSLDQQTVPVQTADAIIDEIKAAFQNQKAPLTNKVLAQNTLSVFETLNARPPGWFSSLAFGTVHFGSLAVSVILVCFMITAKNQGFSAIARAALQEDIHPLDLHEISTFGPTLGQNTDVNTIVATFKKVRDLRNALGVLTNSLPDGVAITRFGDSLLIALPPDDEVLRRKMLARIHPFTTNTFVATPDFHVALDLTCKLPDAGTAGVLKSEMSEYLSVARTDRLIPPWQLGASPKCPLTAQHKLARKTYSALLQSGWNQFTNSEVRELQSKRQIAVRNGESSATQKIDAELKQLQARLRERQFEPYKTAPAGNWDLDVVDLYAQISKAESTGRPDNLLRKELAEKMGSFSDESGDKGLLAYTAYSGYPLSDHDELVLNSLSFENAFFGPVQFVQWLAQRGGKNMTYTLSGYSISAYEDDDEDSP